MDPASRGLRVALAGSIQATFGERSLGDGELGGRRGRLLFAALVLQPDRPIARHELAEVLWDGALPATWRPALRVAASNVRAALAKLLGEPDVQPLAATPAGYALRLPGDVRLIVDVAEAAALVEAAASALGNGDAAGAVDALRSARPVLERPVLGEETGAWAEHRREDGRRRLVQALELLAEARLQLREPTHAAAAASDLLDLEPYRESAHRLLITAHVRAGNDGEALRAYERCRRTLADDLGTVPSPETEALYRRLLGSEPTAAAPTSVALPGRLCLVGRDRALTTLEQLLGDAMSGHGAIALVTGEAGMGKTRVVRELTDRAVAAGAHVLWGTCREPEWAPPFGAVIDMLPALLALAPSDAANRLQERLVEDRDADRGDERVRVREDVRRALVDAAQAAPVVVVLDDLHWSDDGTLAALRHVAPSVPGAALLVVVTLRDAEIEPGSPVGATLAALTRDPGLAHVALPALGEQEVERLVHSVHPRATAIAPEIRAHTGGNPFFVEALLLHLIETGAAQVTGTTPTAVRHVVGQRVGRLSGSAQALLRAAALVDNAFSLAVVAAAAQLGDPDALDAVDECLRTRLIEPSDAPDTYRFCHSIARWSIADAVAPSRRVRLHRRLAEAIEATAGPFPTPAQAGELAGQYHRSASLPGAEAGVEHALRAAAHAEAAGAADRTAAFLSMALDLMLPADPRRTMISARRGRALLTATRYAEGASIVLAAADTLVAGGDRSTAAVVLADGAWAAERAGCTDVAFSLATAGLELTTDDADDDVWARLYLLDLRRQEAHDPRGLGIPIVTADRRRAARRLHADPRFRADMAWAVWEHRDEILARGADDVWALTMWAGRYHEALPMWQRQALKAEARGQVAEAVNAFAGAASCAVALGYLADAERMTETARRLARRIDLRGAFALALVGAREHLVHARASGLEDLMDWVAEFTIHRTDRAQRWAEAASSAATARLLAIEGRHADAKAMLDRVVEVLPATPAVVVASNRLVGDVVATAWFCADTRHLPVLADAVRRVLIEPDFRCPMTEPRHAQARLLGLRGDVEGARHWFAEARAVAEADGLRPLAVLIDHDEAVLLLRSGRPADATPLLTRASEHAARLGMVGWVRRAERLTLGHVG